MSAQLERDFEFAKREVDEMMASASFLDFEGHWQNFLFRLERIWESLLQSAERRKDQDGKTWVTTNSALRKKDPLLSFLKQARNAETHAVEATIENSLVISVQDAFKQSFQIESINLELVKGQLTIDINTPDKHLTWVPKIEPGDPRMLRFKNRQGWHNPPKRHLGMPIGDLHPAAVAMLGLKFYQGTRAALLSAAAGGV